MKRSLLQKSVFRNSRESGKPELLESRLRRDWIPGRASLARKDDLFLKRDFCKSLIFLFFL